MEIVLEKILALEKEKWKIILSMMPSFLENSVNTLLLEEFDTLGIRVKTINCLRSEDMHLIGDLVCNPYLKEGYYSYGWLGKLLMTPNLGKKSFQDLMDGLKKNGITRFVNCPFYLEARFKKTNKNYDFMDVTR